MTLWQSYHLAHSISDALQALADAQGAACLIAGGTDLLLDLQQGRHSPIHTLVDVNGIPELSVLELRPAGLFVGAAVSLNRIVTSRLAIEHAQALVEACALIGGPQVRNTATLGGNVAHALPAADGTVALLALDAQAELAYRGGCRTVPLTDLFLGPGRSALDPGAELLVGFTLPVKQPEQASAFRRVMRPQGVALPILNLAVWVQVDGSPTGDGRITDVRIAIGPAGPVPLRVRSAEAVLRGQPLSEAGIGHASQALLAEARFRTSPLRASAEYRRYLSVDLLHETLGLACRRAIANRGARYG